MEDPYAPLRRIANKVSNWGRWGDDDQVGTLNLITPAAIRRGAESIRTGQAFPLSIDFTADGPQTGAYGRVNPLHYMAMIGRPFQPSSHQRGPRISDDVVVMNLQAATQWDSLAHVYYDGLLYNGVPAEEFVNWAGAARSGVDQLAKRPFVSRGVLLDLPRTLGVERLAPSTVVTAAMLEQALERSRVELEAGDILLVRTGHLLTFLEDCDREAFKWSPPGLGTDTVAWMREHDLAAVAADNNAVEVMPFENPDVEMPLHMLCLRDMGMPLGEMFNLEALAEACAADGCYTFQFVGQPLPFVNGLGSPVNPVAIK
ncbi:cyclase family protein [Rhodococcus olei]|uniref:Cyclase family protein n=1 Tax=Rhodococcus olei TaxID=2161675 RepID=A0ABP8PSZ4_9NOCA